MKKGLPITNFFNQSVVIDLDAPQVYIGILRNIYREWTLLEEVIIYDPHTIQVTLDEFLVEIRRGAVSPIRSRVYIRNSRIIGMTPLDAIVMP